MSMGLDEVRKEIREQARFEAEKIVHDAQEQLKLQKEASKEQLSLYQTTKRKETDQRLSLLERQETVAANLAVKRLIFEKKKELLLEVSTLTKKKLAQMDNKKIIAKLVSKAEQELSIATIYCNAKDAPSVPSKYKTMVSNDINGGIIAENSEKTIRVDYTYDTLFSRAFDIELQNIAPLLFGK